MEHVLEDLERRLKSQGIEDLTAYYKMVNTDKDKFIEEQARHTAIKRLERGLVMDELARVEKIEIDNESLEAEFNKAWANLAMNDENFAKRTKNGTKASREIVDAVAMDSANRLLTRRVLDRIKEIATRSAVETIEEKPKAKKSKKAAATIEASVEPAPAADAQTEAPAADEAAAQPTKKRTTKKKAE